MKTNKKIFGILCTVLLMMSGLMHPLYAAGNDVDQPLETPEFAKEANLGHGWEDLGKTFHADNYDWRVLDIDASGNYFVTTTSIVKEDIQFRRQMNNKYIGSILENYINNVFSPTLTEITPYLQLADISDISDLGNSFVSENGTHTLFPLSSNEVINLFDSAADRMLPTTSKEPFGYWGRTPDINTSYTASYVAEDGAVGTHIPVDYTLGVRPAGWVNFNLPAPTGNRPLYTEEKVPETFVQLSELKGTEDEIGKFVFADDMYWEVLDIDANGNLFLAANELVKAAPKGFQKIQYNAIDGVDDGSLKIYDHSILEQFISGDLFNKMTEIQSYILDADITDASFTGKSSVIVDEKRSPTAKYYKQQDKEGRVSKKLFELSRKELEDYYLTNEDRTLYRNYWTRIGSGSITSPLVNYVYSGGNINPNGNARSRMAVRPAFWMEPKVVKLEGEKSANKEKVKAGDTITYTISYKNVGTIPAINLVVKDSLLDVEFKGSTINNVKVDGVASDGSLQEGITIPQLDVDATVTITFDVTFNEEIESNDGIVNNKAVASNAQVDPVETNVVQQPLEDFELVHLLSGEKSVNKKETVEGDTLSYTIVYENKGTVTEYNVMIQDALDDTEFVDSTINNVKINGEAATADLREGVLIDQLLAGEKVTITFDVTLAGEIKHSDKLVKNQAHAVTDAITEGVPTNEVEVAIEVINRIPILIGTKAADKEHILIGDHIGYTITYTNEGNKEAKDVVITDLLKDSEFETSKITQLQVNGVAVDSSLQNGIHIGDLPIGASAIITFDVEVLAEGLQSNGVIFNVANATGSNFEDVTTNDVLVYIDNLPKENPVPSNPTQPGVNNSGKGGALPITGINYNGSIYAGMFILLSAGLLVFRRIALNK